MRYYEQNLTKTQPDVETAIKNSKLFKFFSNRVTVLLPEKEEDKPHLVEPKVIQSGIPVLRKTSNHRKALPLQEANFGLNLRNLKQNKREWD